MITDEQRRQWGELNTEIAELTNKMLETTDTVVMAALYRKIALLGDEQMRILGYSEDDIAWIKARSDAKSGSLDPTVEALLTSGPKPTDPIN